MKGSTPNPHHLTESELYEGIASDLDDAFTSIHRQFTLYENQNITGKTIVLTVLEIERFIDKIIKTTELGFIENGAYYENHTHNLPQWDYLDLAQEFYAKIREFLFIKKITISFTPKVNLFFNLIQKKFTNLPDLPSNPDQLIFYENGLHQGAKVFNLLIALLRSKIYSTNLEKEISSKAIQCKANLKDCIKERDSILKKYENLLVLRIDLGYLPQHSVNIKLHTVKKHLKKFTASRTESEIFKNLCGYISKIEYDSPDSYRIHLFLFFEISNPLQFIYPLCEIGNYWNTVITRGTGCYYDSYQSQNKYKNIGIGIITSRNHDMKTDLTLAINYLYMSETVFKIHGYGLSNGTIQHKAIKRPISKNIKTISGYTFF